jgi:glycine oxidase
VPLDRTGVLEVAFTQDDVERLRAAQGTADWLDATELAAAEPGLGRALGAVRHPDDGAVDNRVLLRALRALVDAHHRIEVHEVAVAAVRPGSRAGTSRGGTAHGSPAAVSERGDVYAGGALVLAAGAWTPLLAGLPRALPVTPVRGQMLAFGASVLRQVVYGLGGYAVPRVDGRTLVGSTMEHAGFDASTTEAALEGLRARAGALAPALRHAPEVEHWAGLRPVTPDLLPILGADPDHPRLFYACGHSRNGILLGPLSGVCVAAAIAGRPLPADLSPFRPDRPALGVAPPNPGTS